MFYWAWGKWQREPGNLRRITEMLWSMSYPEAVEAIARGQRWLDTLSWMVEDPTERHNLVMPAQWVLWAMQDNQVCRIEAAHRGTK